MSEINDPGQPLSGFIPQSDAHIREKQHYDVINGELVLREKYVVTEERLDTLGKEIEGRDHLAELGKLRKKIIDDMLS